MFLYFASDVILQISEIRHYGPVVTFCKQVYSSGEYRIDGEDVSENKECWNKSTLLSKIET